MKALMDAEHSQSAVADLISVHSSTICREDGFIYREIAQLMDISVKTVETQIGRCLRTLRWLLVIYLPDLMLIYAIIHNLA
jgi:DNA-binding NarL/FixJ family response regulator